MFTPFAKPHPIFAFIRDKFSFSVIGTVPVSPVLSKAVAFSVSGIRDEHTYN